MCLCLACNLFDNIDNINIVYCYLLSFINLINHNHGKKYSLTRNYIVRI